MGMCVYQVWQCSVGTLQHLITLIMWQNSQRVCQLKQVKWIIFPLIMTQCATSLLGLKKKNHICLFSRHFHAQCHILCPEMN